MEPDVSTQQNGATPQAFPGAPREVLGCGEDSGEPPPHEPPINDCKRELDALLASLGDP